MHDEKIIEVMAKRLATELPIGGVGYHDHLAHLVLTALSSAGYMVVEGWKTMESVRQADGDRVLGYGVCGFDDVPSVTTVAWEEFRKEWWVSPNEASEYNPEPCRLTHWMPLPPPPQVQRPDEEQEAQPRDDEPVQQAKTGA